MAVRCAVIECYLAISLIPYKCILIMVTSVLVLCGRLVKRSLGKCVKFICKGIKKCKTKKNQ